MFNITSSRDIAKMSHCISGKFILFRDFDCLVDSMGNGHDHAHAGSQSSVCMKEGGILRLYILHYFLDYFLIKMFMSLLQK